MLPALHSQPVERGYTVVPIDLNAPELNIPMGKKKKRLLRVFLYINTFASQTGMTATLGTIQLSSIASTATATARSSTMDEILTFLMI